MPLPGTGVFHPDWSAHHRPTATTAMTATCRITRNAGDGTTGPDGTWTPASPTTVYTGPCRVTSPPFSREEVIPSGATQVTQRRYGVFIEWDADEIHIGDQVEILTAKDPLMPGKIFRVVDVAYTSEQWQRNLACEEVEGT